MAPTSFGQVFIIWTLLFVTLGNTISKSKVQNVLSNLNGSIRGFNVFPTFLVGVNGRKHSLCFWWKELKQYTHWDLVETNVWRTILEIRGRKFLLCYKMNFETFNNLVLELTPFLESSHLNPIKTQF